jgi:hypothetical protein
VRGGSSAIAEMVLIREKLLSPTLYIVHSMRSIGMAWYY